MYHVKCMYALSHSEKKRENISEALIRISFHHNVVPHIHAKATDQQYINNTVPYMANPESYGFKTSVFLSVLYINFQACGITCHLVTT